ncbi:energy transducer TonB [Shewanella algicola]|uniref:Energy transducer TonB n=1 Tax=Shewanella algicola TaxID=640633 RepID=A0A9X1ZH80_9GAMM|nr:energy transducer TonB [Shewanella algicola]MCL1106798.1 energy transducer TonB [Shewanella algicola]
MRLLVLAVLLSAVVLFPSEAKRMNIYGETIVTEITPESGAMWTRVNDKEPMFPIELAKARMAGCTILSFDVIESGKADNIQTVISIPNTKISQHATSIVSQWQWQTAQTPTAKESHTVRLDFCLGLESLENTQQACAKQIQLPCE